jgi:LysR family hydrogen peroxide-inducible transcriptional activator
VQMVGAGIGVTMIPEMAIRVETRSAAVNCTAFSGPQPGRTIGIIWRKSTPLSDELREIADVVRSSGAQIRTVA